MAEGPISTPGVPLTLYCPNCGAPNPADSLFCSQCGAKLTPVDAVPVATVQPTAVPSPITWVPAEAQVQYAGFWMRLVALILDRLLIGVVLMPFYVAIIMSVVAAGDAVRMPDEGQMIVTAIGAGVLGLIAQWLYFAVMESSRKQATFGKQLLGIKVTDLQGERITFARASGRFFGKILSSLTLLIGYIMAAFTERHQALHDMLAGTVVVKK